MDFDINRDLKLGEEISNQLHYYATRLNFRGDISEHRKISWLVNDIISKRINSELKRNKIKKFELPVGGIHDTRDDDPKYAFIGGIKRISEPEKKYPKIVLEDIIKKIKDSKFYEYYDKDRMQSDKKFSVPPPNNICGIPFIRGQHYDYIILFKENEKNLYRLVYKTRQDTDYFIITWLIEFLKENLTTKEVDYINNIQKNITLAKETIETRLEKSKLPEWDLERIKNED